MPKFFNKNGKLTDYALSCGYYQTKTNPANVETTLWKEHSVYHVRSHDFNGGKRLTWESFRTLTQARKRFNQLN